MPNLVEMKMRMRWSPTPPFPWTRDTRALRAQLATYIKRMIAEQHEKGGIPGWKLSMRVKGNIKGGGFSGHGVTGWRTGRLARGWHPGILPTGAYCDNKTPYATDFYEGHPRRRVWVPSYIRRLTTGSKNRRYLGRGNKKGRKTIGLTTVRGHYTTEAAQVARPLTFPARWVYLIEKLFARYYATGRL